MLRRVVLVRTDVSEEVRASFIRVTRIGELGTTLAVTSDRRTLRRSTKYPVFLDFLVEYSKAKLKSTGDKAPLFKAIFDRKTNRQIFAYIDIPVCFI
jgi:hypothetical protein